MFVGIDGEGVTGPCEYPDCRCVRFSIRASGQLKCRPCGHHKDHHRHLYVLLDCGGQQLENPIGLSWEEIFPFLYSQFEANPHAAFVGFFLGYDFNMWLKGLPEHKAWLLLTDEGRRKREMRRAARIYMAPVRLNEDHIAEGRAWEIECLPGPRRLSIRPMVCDCALRPSMKCTHQRPPYMQMCDAGPIFQSSLLNIIDPKEWDDHPVCTSEEYRLVERGKQARADAQLDDDMRRYNRLENQILARVLGRIDLGLRSVDIKLGKSEWYGPGPVAAAWLKLQGAPRRQVYEGAG